MPKVPNVKSRISSGLYCCRLEVSILNLSSVTSSLHQSSENTVRSPCIISILALSASSFRISFSDANHAGWKICGLKAPTKTIITPSNFGLEPAIIYFHYRHGADSSQWGKSSNRCLLTSHPEISGSLDAEH